MAERTFREILELAFNPAGVTSGLGTARKSISKTRQAADVLRRTVGTALAAGGAALVAIAAQHDRARASLAKSTGAQGEDLKRLQGVYLSTLGAVNTSAESAVRAVSELSGVAGGGTGKVLTDAATAAERAQVAFGAFDPGNLAAVLDDIPARSV